jgi:uncharacterized protein (TIGR02391 family)
VTPITSIDEVTLRAICDVLGDTNDGLTNADISNLLRSCGISDPVSASNKRSRLFEALVTRQQQDGCANNVIAFIQAASKPVRFVERRQDFESWRTRLNDEHAGLMNLLKGLFGAFRNTTAHAPRIKWVIKEQDAFDMLTLASLLHRRLDVAVKTR